MTIDATRASGKALPEALRLAIGRLENAETYIHAAWMAARSIEQDNSADSLALQAIIHMAGEALDEARRELRKAGAA